MMKYKFGAWNVRTLLNNDRDVERRSAIIADTLNSHNIDFAALSETRLPGESQLTESSTGYTFFWSGRPENERRQDGVAIVVRTRLLVHLVSLPRAVSERLMTARIRLRNNAFLTIVSAYAPTMTNTDEIKERFYESLSNLVSAVPRGDKLLLLGDFNARVGKEHRLWEGPLGHHGVGRSNSNGQLLLEFCARHDLLITNTVFKQNLNKVATWMHPRSGHWHLIDYAIVRRRDRNDIHLTRAVRSSTMWSDHCLVTVMTSLSVPPKIRRQDDRAGMKPLNTDALRDHDKRQELRSNISEKITQELDLNNASLDDLWDKLKPILRESSAEVLGFKRRNHQDWFDEHFPDIQVLLGDLHEAHAQWLSNRASLPARDRYKHQKGKVQRAVRSMKENWWKAKAQQLQSLSNDNDIRGFYKELKAIHGPNFGGAQSLLSGSGDDIITEPDAIVNRWAEHFHQLLNRPSAFADGVFDELPRRPPMDGLAANPNLGEIRSAMASAKCGKSPGPDLIPPEVFKHGPEELVQAMHRLACAIWEAESVPQDFKDANIVHLYKNKGDRRNCNNHRGISLLSIAGKIMARMIVNRLVPLSEGLQPESQNGFRAERGTVGMIFSARQIQEKCREQHKDLYMIFIDLEKAFDSVCRPGLWKLLLHSGCPSKVVNIIRSFHDGMKARVVDSGTQSDHFPVENGVKQGCVMAPLLFGIVIAALIYDAYIDCNVGVEMDFRFDGGIFNLQRLKAKTKVSTQLIRELMFADDCAVVAHSEQDAQLLVDRFSASATRFGLTVSVSKTEVLCQPAPGRNLPPPSISINGETLKVVNSFKYLGGVLSEDCSADADVGSRIAKAAVAFGKLERKLWGSHDVSLNTKVVVYKAAVITVLLYNCETWTLYRKQLKQLDAFHMRCLRRIAGISWQQLVPNTEVLERCGVRGIEAYIMESRLRWTGHVIRMPNHRIPKQILYGELRNGKRSRGGQRLRYKDQLNSTAKVCKLGDLEQQALDRDEWKAVYKSGVATFERNRVRDAKEKRRRRKEGIPGDEAFPCDECGRLCYSRIGLHSHKAAHTRRGRARPPN